LVDGSDVVNHSNDQEWGVVNRAPKTAVVEEDGAVVLVLGVGVPPANETVFVVGIGATVAVTDAPDGGEAVDSAAPGGASVVDGAVVDGAIPPYGALARKTLWVRTGVCCTLTTTPITKLLISVHTPHKELRICLEEIPGDGLLRLL
jgi:hypothetical protein